jgi:OPA family glycerol-3-phosphate transporter-like MFS transporter
LFTGYAGYYICRSNLSVATPLLLEEMKTAGVTKEHLGVVASAGVLLYAVGKITNGLTTDFLGGRRMFLLGIFTSVLCTVVFGLAGGVAAFVAIWAANRYVQSMGWVALVKVSSHWYPLGIQATVLGLLSMSFLLGDAFARFYLGAFIQMGVGWRGIFFIAAATFAVIGVACWLTLRSSPGEVGAEEPLADPINVFGEAGNQTRPDSLRGLCLPLFASFPFWTICVLNIGLTLIRETFNFWTPTYLTEMVGLDAGSAAMYSLMFPAVGAVSALSAGVVSDRLGGRHGRVCVPALLLLIFALIALQRVDVQGRPILAISLISLVSLFLIAPYSFLSGVMALNFGGKRGSSTAAGFIDSAGYFGATVSGWGIGAIAERSGWHTALTFLAITAAVSLLVALTYWVHQELREWRVRPTTVSE